MKKKIFYFLIFIILSIVLFLNLKSTRYIGVNYSVSGKEITNFKKIKDFYERHNNYKSLVKKISRNSVKENEILKIGRWVYLNIKKPKDGEDIIDSHPWTIVERKIGTQDQFSDILSVLFVYKQIDSFYIFNHGKYDHSLTYFKSNKIWSVIDPYYGIYFLNDNNEFCSIAEHKSKKCLIFHLKYKKNIQEEIDYIFFDKDFNNIDDIVNYYGELIKNSPTSQDIEKTNIYLRGGRSYVQKPFHRLFYQIQKILKFI